jgi:signal transduction histidine kinase
MMKLAPLNSIAARITITIVAAIVLGIVLEIVLASVLTYVRAGNERPYVLYSRSVLMIVNPRLNVPMMSSKIVTIARVLASAPEAEWAGIIAALAEPAMQLALRATPLAEVDERDDGRLSFLRQLIQMQFGEPSPSLRVSVFRPPAHGEEAVDLAHSNATSATALVEIALPDGRWLAVTLIDFLPATFITWPLLLGPLLVLAGLLSVWTARRLAAPIRDFAQAAERLGVDMTAPPLAERGPHELRTAIRAFNVMQERLRRFLADRTQMLAAISHDLRAPLARLRLRAELVEDDEQQRKMFGDLNVMNAMIDTTLAFARDDARQDPRRLVDLSVLVADVCEDIADIGGKACYLGPRGIDVTCRPSAIRRAVTNLVDNAVNHAGSARVQIVREAKRVVILIEDDGPGIAAEQQEKVFAPFYRLDPSRNPDNGGVGLGLSVARTIAREHGGDVTLANGDVGGLRVRVELPAQANEGT